MYKLLIVDDNLIQIESVVTFLNTEKFGISMIYTAETAAAALEIVAAEKPDIILTDIVMPQINGIEFSQKAHELSPHSHFIYMSCYDDSEYLQSAIKNRVASYLLKPIDPFELDSAFERTVSFLENDRKNADSRRILDESLHIFRENFLYRLIYSENMNLDYFEKTVCNLNFNIYSCFVVAQAEIHSATTDIYSFASLLKEAFSGKIIYIIVENESHLIILFMGEESSEIFQSDICRRLEEFCLNHAGSVRSIGISSSAGSLSEISVLLKQSELALEDALVNDEYIVCYNNTMLRQNPPEFSDIKSDLSSLFTSATDESITAFINKYYSSHMEQEDKKSLCISIFTSLQYILAEYNINTGDLFGKTAAIWNKIDNFDTLSDVHQWIYNILKSTLAYADSSKQSKYEKIVNDIKLFISENYGEISSIEQISEHLQISASYAKSIFKKHTGKTIFDYLLNYRMGEAKKLLSDPYCKIYEVSERVGYKSPAHFSTTFKRITGMTPNDYHNNPHMRSDSKENTDAQ